MKKEGRKKVAEDELEDDAERGSGGGKRKKERGRIREADDPPP